MATIIGGIGTSHVPAIGGAIAEGRQDEPYWKPLFDGYPPVQQWLTDNQPDTLVVIFNDHGLNFFLDTLPTFAIGAAHGYDGDDEGWGIPATPPLAGHPELSWHIIESVINDGFDITTCQEMKLDHAVGVPLRLLYPPPAEIPVRVVPVHINTVQHPLPRPDRALAFGRALGRAVASFADERVAVLATGGLSHQLDGERAGFINRDFDQACLDALIDDPGWIAAHSIHQLVELAGTQGVEILMWLIMRGMLSDEVAELHRNYHVPISNTAAGLQLLA
jgi:protocatechuate 4,5-dioxygenase beta chain